MTKPLTTVRLTMCVALLAGLPSLGARPYRGGAVATAHPVASQAALEILDKGGNATDAAVAAAFALAVVGPYHSGIAGGGFALLHDAKAGATKVLDFREVAPRAATREMYLRDGKVVPGLSTDGVLAVAVPGAAKGYLTALAKHGSLPPSVVLAPAIRAAKKGFWVSPKYRQMAESRLECLRKDPEAARIFLRPGQSGAPEAPPLGTLLRQPELGKTLERLAKEGERAFYRGSVARAIVDTVRAGGGILALEDLESYDVRWREPLEGSYRGHRVLTMPPPSAGGLAVVQVLEAMEAGGPQAYRDPASLHRFVESLRRVYVDRAKYLGDPAFVRIPLDRLSSREYVAELMQSYDPKRATPSRSLLPPAPGDKGAALPHPEGGERKNTTHISVMDRHGNAVALTTTLNYGFGACVVARGTGVLLNDEMDDFAMKPLEPNVYGLVTGEANAIAPGKVPLSSMSPTLVFAKGDPKRVLLAVGSPGGPTIPTTVLQVVMNVIDHGMDLTRAVSAGRVHHQYLPDVVMVDHNGLDPGTEEALRAKGHQLQRSAAWGDAEAVMEDPATGLRYAASDPRNEGQGLGQD